jgi:RHS repeat-associated protein
MKRLSIFFILLIIACIVSAQDSNRNYILMRKMLNNAGSSYIDDIIYYDGLGRPFQTVQKTVQNGNSVNKNLATLQEYDAAGRETNSWLPIPITSAVYLDPANFKSSAPGRYGNDSRPYSQNVYEASPLNRVLQQYGPGAAWYNAGRAVKTEYLTNTATAPLNCRNYTVSDSYVLGGGSNNYAVGQLSVVKTTDEDLNVSYTFTDKLGHVVLTRQMKGSEAHDTYYVYNDLGNLCFVLQPKYQEEANLDKFSFRYKYDGRSRCIWKQLPGAQYIEYVYDTADRLTFSQDGNQRASSRWMYYLYDSVGRLTQQGECTGKNVSSNPVVLVQNYYDDYGFRSQPGFNNSNFTDGETTGKGSLTGSAVTVLGSSTKLYKAYYYDIKSRVTKVVQSNLLSGYDITNTVYTFSDKPATVTHTHTASSKTPQTEVYTYTYDHEDRISKVEHTLGGNKITLYDCTYDDLGRLLTKQFHGTSTNKLTYAYNLRSWLTGITAARFTQNLYYNTGVGAARYNGNISSMTWKAGNESTIRGYKFTYDALNRMLNATYGETASINTNTNRFSENVSSYDKNGNITSLQRYGQTGASAYGLLDNLTYTLSGNLLNRVDDAVTASAYNGDFEFKDNVKQAGEYTYDANGNLMKDLNKGISSIQYNILNLPSVVTFSDGSTITCTYAADGTKLHTGHTAGGTTTLTYYCGNVIYEGTTAKLLLEGEGYVNLTGTQQYHYYLKDHQDNNRVVINQAGTVEETNHYYPFGGVFAAIGNVQHYKYNGKELNTKKGLNWYDYGARYYDPALGRWHVPDLLNESTHSSAYSYCINNPSRYIDVMGLDTISAIDLTPQMWRESFNPQNDVIALNQVTITNNNSNTSFNVNALNTGISFLGTAASSAAGMRYTERSWGSGYFRTSGGKAYPLSILAKQSNGKYVRGVQGLRIGAQTAKNLTQLSRRIGNVAGVVGLGFSLNNIMYDINVRNSIDLAASVTSLFYWEVGTLYALGSSYLDWVIMPNVQQIQNNIKNGAPATRNVYNPQTGMLDY